ncbi:MAG: hypothetical protein JW782_05545 [Candidatus Saganbacteria bacterium]|nr:hypothetical protein [Candidatus Saganbacteria bacterium]
MVMQANITSTAAVSRPATPQTGTPHILVSSDQISQYITQINNLYSTPEHHRFETIPATPGRLNPEAVAEDAPPPELQPVVLQLHPNVESAASGPVGSPIEVAEGTSALAVIAQLGQLVDPELSQLAQAALQEQQVLSQGGIA